MRQTIKKLSNEIKDVEIYVFVCLCKKVEIPIYRLEQQG